MLFMELDKVTFCFYIDEKKTTTECYNLTGEHTHRNNMQQLIYISFAYYFAYYFAYNFACILHEEEASLTTGDPSYERGKEKREKTCHDLCLK